MYFTTKFVSIKSTAQCRYFKVLDRLSLARDKNIFLIQLGQECYIVAVSGQGISMSNPIKIGDLKENETSHVIIPNQLMINKLLNIKKLVATKISGIRDKKADNIDTLIDKAAKRIRTYGEGNNEKN